MRYNYIELVLKDYKNSKESMYCAYQVRLWSIYIPVCLIHLSYKVHITYEGCSKRIAYFKLDTSNVKLAQKCSFHAIEVLPVARNARLQPMYLLPEGVTVR